MQELWKFIGKSQQRLNNHQHQFNSTILILTGFFRSFCYT
jgi:hypothetical protein